MTYSLSRPRRGIAPPMGAGGAYGHHENAGAHQEAFEYLSSRMLIPGAHTLEKKQIVTQELDSMTLAERTWLEMEMAEKTETLHTFDYEAGPWT